LLDNRFLRLLILCESFVSFKSDQELLSLLLHIILELSSIEVVFIVQSLSKLDGCVKKLILELNVALGGLRLAVLF
jgi:hypothetical protein